MTQSGVQATKREVDAFTSADYCDVTVTVAGIDGTLPGKREKRRSELDASGS